MELQGLHQPSRLSDAIRAADSAEARNPAFYQNDRAVRTVSSEQVRRPIFRDGLEQWRSYEPWLDPLKTGLGPALDRWRD